MNEENTLTNYDEYEQWNELAIDSITYKQRTLEDWAEELIIPEVCSNNLEEIELANYRAIKNTEVVGKHLSLSKATFLLSKASYQSKLNKEKNIIVEEIESSSTKRLPSQENLERMALNKSQKEWRVMLKSEIIYEFWQTQSYKLNQIHTRLTSLNIIKNIESKQMVV